MLSRGGMRGDVSSTIGALALAGAAILGCGSVAITPSTTSTGAAGAGGAVTTGGGGAGGSCLDGCPDCAPLAPWSVAFSTAGYRTEILGFAVAPNGTVTVTSSDWTPEYPSKSVGNHVTRIDPSGKIVWQIPDSHAYLPLSDGACGAFIEGGLGPDSTSVLGMPVSCDAKGCPYVAHLDASGAPTWLDVQKPAADGGAFYSAADAAGARLLLAGRFEGSLDVGPLQLATEMGTATPLISMSAEGTPIWGRVITTPSGQLGPFWGPPGGLAASPAGDVVIVGNFGAEIDFGAGPVPKPAGPGDTGTYVAAYDPAGNLRFGKVFANPGGVPGWSVGFDASGDVILAASVGDAMDLGGGPVGEAGKFQIIVARLDSAGNHVWSRALPDVFGGARFALNSAGHIFVSAGAAVVVELDASGATVATHTLGGTGKRWVHTVRIGLGDAVFVAGDFDETVDLGQGLLTAGDARSAFVGVLTL